MENNDIRDELENKTISISKSTKKTKMVEVKITDSHSAREYLSKLLQDLQNGIITDKQAKSASFLVQTLVSLDKRIQEETTIIHYLILSKKRIKIETNEVFNSLINVVRTYTTDENFQKIQNEYSESLRSVDENIEKEVEELKKRIKRNTSFNLSETTEDNPELIVEDIKSKIIDLPILQIDKIKNFITHLGY